MHGASFLQDIVVTLTAALLVILPSRRLKIPAAVGFMLTGVLIGPGAFRLIGNAQHVQVLAEVGVSMLLFMIGLEFSLARLKEIGRAFLVAGPLQVVGTIAFTAAALALLPGRTPFGPGIFAGMLLALSSTAMVLRLYGERQEHQAPQGRLVLGILLFQDFAILGMLLFVPALAGKGTIHLGPRLLLGAAAALVLWLAARFLMPRLVGAVIRSGVRELYVMSALAICLGFSLLTASLGLSPALGAFVGGLLVSESEYAHQIVAEILPFRDLLSSIFFVAIGMLLVPRFLVDHAPTVLAALVFTVALKTLVAAGVVRLLGFPPRVAMVVGLSLAQVGEFSFVLASVGASNGLNPPLGTQTFLAVAVLSLVLTPFLIQAANWIGARAGAIEIERSPAGVPGHADAGHAAVAAKGDSQSLTGHVVVAGYGVNGRNIARVLQELGVPYVVLEMDTAIIRRARSAGERIRFGDVSRPEGLHAAHVERAAVLVLAISDPNATRLAVTAARRSHPGLYIIARTRQVAEVAELLRIGADEAIPEEFETSIAILTRVLRRFHVPGNVIRIQEMALRREGYSFLRGGDRTGMLTASVSRLIEGAMTDTFYLDAGSPVAGRSLASLDLRARTRALIIAVVRDGKHHVNPEPEFELREGDTLVLVGDHGALEAAFESLSSARPS